jgi:acetyl esterase/lipase
MRAMQRRSLALGAAATALAAASPPQDLSFVNPQLRPYARDLIARFSGGPALTPANLPAARLSTRAPAKAPAGAPPTEKRLIKGPPGAPDVTIYLINAKPGAARPAILHTHGGGFMLGSARDSVPNLQPIAAALDCVIVTVEYRLAPEVTYAGSIEDNYAALSWVHANAAALGADPHRIAVMGESAGGGHAALLAIAARDRGQIPLVLQVLIYPMLDDRTGTTRTPAPPIGKILWTPPLNRTGWACFLGQPPGTDRVPARAVPARTKSLAGLPPAFIGVGSIDLFVDEDIDYARRLIDAGVPTELTIVPGAFHGFDGIAAQTPLARNFAAAKLEALRRGFVKT